MTISYQLEGCTKSEVRKWIKEYIFWPVAYWSGLLTPYGQHKTPSPSKTQTCCWAGIVRIYAGHTP